MRCWHDAECVDTRDDNLGSTWFPKLRKTSNATPSLVAGELADEADLEETCAAAGVENAAEPVAAALGVEAPAANGAPVGPNAVADGGADFDEYGDEFWDEKEEREAKEDLNATLSKDWAEGLLDRKNDPRVCRGRLCDTRCTGYVKQLGRGVIRQ